MGGVYNKWKDDGLIVDRKRRCDVFAIDLNSTIKKTNTNIIGEWAWVFADPEDVDLLMEDGLSGDDLKEITEFVVGKPVGESTASAKLSKKIGNR